MERVIVSRLEPNLCLDGLDIRPFTIGDAELGRSLGVNFDKRLADFVAQARDVAVLLIDELNQRNDVKTSG